MDLHYKREAMVGAIVLAGAAVFVVGTMWLGGKSFGRDNVVPVRFEDIGNLKTSSPVKVSGVQVGKVDKIIFDSVGSVRVLLALTQNVPLHADAAATIEAVGVLGDVEIVLDPGADSLPLPAGQVLEGGMAPGVGGMVSSLGDQARAVMSGAQLLLNQRTADDLHETLKAMQRLMSVYADTRTGPTAEMTKLMVSLQSVSARLDSTLANPALVRSLEHMDSATAGLNDLTRRLATTTARMDTLVSNINAGKGTLGQVATNPALYDQLNATLKSMQALLDSVQAKPGKLTVQVKMF
ncbi:MAG TPA: MlaD family protein [Gemmatimonadales bacterium]|nr:MlaD family protein [Gemmatimonadales bacterium]